MMATANKLSVIPCGAMHANLPFLLLKPGVSIKPRSQKDDKIDWVEVPTHCVLVETDEGKLLWDTSCPQDWEERWGPTGLQEFFPYDAVADDEYLDQQLHKMGVGLDEIDYVVLSHLHFDHAGNANMFKNTNAKMLCSDKEKEFALNFEGDFQGAHLKADYEDINWEIISGDTEFLPGVKMIQSPGHTPGCMSMQVDLPDSGTMIFTSDAVYMGESYGPPAAPAAIVNNLEDWFASVEKLRGIQEQTNATMVFGHDNEQIKQLRKAPEASYT
jgi:glyoxylase-like metal-dependent hydrolase (beta-lactamase superfamily II)